MIGFATKVCPRCAERVKTAAKVCRYCGHEFTDPSIARAGGVILTKQSTVETASGVRSRAYVVAAVMVAAVVLVAVLGWAMSPAIEKPAVTSGTMSRRAAPAPKQEITPSAPELAVGETFEWNADKEPEEAVRRVEALLVKVTRRTDDDMVAPLVTVSHGGDTVTMVGEMVGSTYTHRVSAVRNIVGAPAVVMLQSFSGGAHCCNHVQLAGLSEGRLKVVDLGSWDGDELSIPSDVNGDGVADFVERDNAFLYSFAAYAMSYAPPTILNVTGGRVVDVSRSPAYRRLYLDEMAKAGEACRTAADGMDRNGACPSYVASAARVGRLDEAWAEMMRSYSATEDWEYPTGCGMRTKAECPETSRIVYKSYPEALLAFLKEHGYVRSDWTPPAVDAGQYGTADEPVGTDD